MVRGDDAGRRLSMLRWAVARSPDPLPPADKVKAIPETMRKQKAAFAVLITLELYDTPTFRDVVVGLGTRRVGATRYDRLQNLSVRDMLERRLDPRLSALASLIG